jgi:hypothetical protein
MHLVVPLVVGERCHFGLFQLADHWLNRRP